MTSNRETPSDHAVAIRYNAVSNALFYVSWSKLDTLLDLSGFIRELDKIPEVKNHAAYVVFKQANSLLEWTTWPYLDSLIIETRSKFRSESHHELEFFENIILASHDNEKRNLVQRWLLSILLLRLVSSWLYTPDTTWISWPILAVISSLLPDKT